MMEKRGLERDVTEHWYRCFIARSSSNIDCKLTERSSRTKEKVRADVSEEDVARYFLQMETAESQAPCALVIIDLTVI
jgi:hypothetical protein